MKRVVRASLMACVLGALTTGVVGPVAVRADNASYHLQHNNPPLHATAGRDLVLQATFQDRSVTTGYYTEATVTLTYAPAAGAAKHISQVVRQIGPNPATATFTVPGADVATGALTYSFDLLQVRCRGGWSGGTCLNYRDQAPGYGLSYAAAVTPL